MITLAVEQLGIVPYAEALELQGRHRERVQASGEAGVLLLLEHPPVYTRGRRTGSGELPMGESWYRAQGIEVVDSDRGGRVTYHGPGQLVGYPVVPVEDVVAFVRRMERAIVTALGDFGIEARTRTDEGADYTGVWVGERKIASIGIHVQRGVSTHGFAVNVDNDLQPFEWIVPCGLEDVRMTSVCRETGRGGNLPRFREVMARRFADAA
jgi:lipoyl(octanoyl) transferase